MISSIKLLSEFYIQKLTQSDAGKEQVFHAVEENRDFVKEVLKRNVFCLQLTKILGLTFFLSSHSNFVGFVLSVCVTFILIQVT